MIWAGSDDGLVHVTRDGGKNWQNVTPRGAPEWGTVLGIEASRWDAGVAYVVYDAHRLDDETPYLWKTTDYGRSWTSLTRGLDNEVYLKVLREDSKQRGLLYLGTERGMLVSHDDGRNWTSLQLNLPTVAIADMVVAGNDLVLGTLGRSAYILDDLTPIREMSPTIAKQALHLFPPPPAIRWTYAAPPWGSEAGSGSNPSRGAIVTYYLADEPEGEVTLEVLDSAGSVIRKLSSELEAPYIAPDHPDANPWDEPAADLEAVKGVNRAAWDLAYAGAKRIPDSTNDAGDVSVGPMVVPGEYRLRLTVGSESVEQTVTVLPDPRAETDIIRDLQAQTEFLLNVRDRISALVADVELCAACAGNLKHGTRTRRRSARDAVAALGEQALASIAKHGAAFVQPECRRQLRHPRRSRRRRKTLLALRLAVPYRLRPQWPAHTGHARSQ